jgi:transposase-like protein
MNRRDGIRSLQSIMDRCIIEGQCWIWKGATSGDNPRCHVAAGVLPGWKGGVCSVRRASYFFGIGPMTPENVAYRKTECPHELCVAPAHTAQGPAGMQLVASRKRVGVTPQKLAQLTIARSKQAIPADKVRAIAKAIESGERMESVCARFKVNHSTASKVKNGKHFHQLQRSKLVRSASVFAYAEAA